MTAVIVPEWEPQDAVLLVWPHDQTDWQDILPAAERAFAQLAAAISRYQPLLLLTPNLEQHKTIQSQLAQAQAKLNQVYFLPIQTNDTWARDFGPISLQTETTLQLLDFRFNGWGQRYQANLDDQINQQLAASGILKAKLQSHDFILEGGSIESDGMGTLLTTTRCLLTQQRNGTDQTSIAAKLHELLPIKRILWLEHGYLAGDDTDSHIDNLARFVDSETIVYTQCKDQQDEHYAELKRMEQALQQFRTLNNKPYRLHALPWPEPCYSQIDGRRLPASYANFLIINNAVLIPQFGGAGDQQACKVLQDCLPEREIIGIDSRLFIEQNGGIHCLTMQLAAGTLDLAKQKPANDTNT